MNSARMSTALRRRSGETVPSPRSLSNGLFMLRSIQPAAETAVLHLNPRKRRELQAIRERPGNIGSRLTAWWARRIRTSNQTIISGRWRCVCLTSSSNYRPVFPRTPDDRHRVAPPPAASAAVRH
jgi:hypothetical protein